MRPLVGFASAKMPRGTSGRGAIGADPAVELEPLLERATAAHQLGRVVGQLDVHASITRRPDQLVALT